VILQDDTGVIRVLFYTTTFKHFESVQVCIFFTVVLVNVIAPLFNKAGAYLMILNVLIGNFLK
jgi:hypothetical protein